MIREIKIQNFKSVQDLTMSLGRFNVLIGANGSGKSNILEAIAFGGAASADKLDNEFLVSRGIRLSASNLMKSAFETGINELPIVLEFNKSGKSITTTIEEDEGPILKWRIREKEMLWMGMNILASEFSNDKTDEQDPNKLYFPDIDINQLKKNYLSERVLSRGYHKLNFQEDLSAFAIYSPEITSLRTFDDYGQLKPLGIKGDGLFNVLEIFYDGEDYGKKTIDELRSHLHIIEWFDDFEAVFDKVTGRHSLVVKDRHVSGVALNQGNVNEGFLFLLFYISLFISKETPAFFAIDNIEASFHPKLCEELIKNLVELAKKHDKQVILTTHNPFVLDGLDLSDPEQKLFVVHRNADGETVADNISKAPKSVKLSEAWMRGYIGGQPETIS